MVIMMLYKMTLKKRRLLNNLTQNQIAEILGISRSAYSKYEKYYEIIPIKHLICFCNHFNILIDEIFNLKISYKNELVISNVFDKKIMGTRLKEFRKEHKLTQEKLAQELNTTKSVIAGYESGRRIIATPFLYQICHKYQISADYILGRIN